MARPLTILRLLLVVAAFGPSAALAAGDPPQVTVVDIGDSLIIGYGVSVGSQFPTLLEQKLKDAGYAATVKAQGYLETSKTGVLWLSWTSGKEALAGPNTVAILELGSNDCLQLPKRMPLAVTQANLDQILAQLTAKQIPVLVVGTAAYAGCGADYAAQFAQIFVDLAAKYGALLYPEFKTGVLDHTDLLQSDLDHPNAVGEAVVVTNMLPVVEQLIARVRAPQLRQ